MRCGIVPRETDRPSDSLNAPFMDMLQPDSSTHVATAHQPAPDAALAEGCLYYVRVGVLGHVGRFAARDSRLYARHTRVVCRTPRGLEVGEVLGPAVVTSQLPQCDGTLLRPTAAEDELLIARLEKNRHQAFNACVDLLRDMGSDAVLMDVEHLFDTRSLYFYFLGPVSDTVEALTQQLAEAYESQAQFGAFADAVTQGCGPACGTDEAAGCGTGCSTCALLGGCKSSHG